MSWWFLTEIRVEVGEWCRDQFILYCELSMDHLRLLQTGSLFQIIFLMAYANLFQPIHFWPIIHFCFEYLQGPIHSVTQVTCFCFCSLTGRLQNPQRSFKMTTRTLLLWAFMQIHCQVHGGTNAELCAFLTFPLLTSILVNSISLTWLLRKSE